MADERESLPITDVVSLLISPILIMLMVGSLVFFLIEVVYAGRYEGRLLYTFFFFVAGSVLIARIAIQQGHQRAMIYGLGLGGACFAAMIAFVEYPNGWLKVLGPVLNLVLMGIVWWSANKLTWDCTHLAEDAQASGRGVLAAAGLDNTRATTADDDEAEFDPDRSSTATEKKKRKNRTTDEATTGFFGWLPRFQKYREFRKKRPHTPGVWVLYFALAALPLFALGQSIIPADDSERRRDTFLLMALYVGSALGLLMTTTLMGLKRYLAARNAELSPTLTLGWLGLGAGLIAMFLACGAVLPRPHSETPLFTLNKGGTQNRSASKNAQVRDSSAGKGEGNQGQKQEAGKGEQSGKNGEKGGNKGEKGSGKGDSKQGGDTKKKSDEGSDSGKSGEDGKNQKEGNAEDEEQEKGSSEGGSSTSKLTQALETISKGLKWLVWVVIAIAIIAGLFFFGLKWLAPFTSWARGLLDWLRALFGQKESKQKQKAEAQAAVQAVSRPPPFAEFSNPFQDGSAEQRDPAELVRYTYAAFQSWAWDNRIEHTADETPAEFAARIAEEFPDLEAPASTLNALLMRVQFSLKGAPTNTLELLEQFWDELATAERIIEA